MAERKPSDDLTICGGDDFLAEQGIADPDEFRVKSHLCHEIQTIAEERSLTAADLVRLAGTPDRDAAAILRSRHDGIAVWKLIKMLSALGADVLITVNPSGLFEKGIIHSKNIEEQESEQPEPWANEQEEAARAPGMRRRA